MWDEPCTFKKETSFEAASFGVHKFVKGGVSTLKNENWNFFDMKDGYRSVRIESIVEVTYDGVTILAEGL